MKKIIVFIVFVVVIIISIGLYKFLKPVSVYEEKEVKISITHAAEFTQESLNSEMIKMKELLNSNKTENIKLLFTLYSDPEAEHPKGYNIEEHIKWFIKEKRDQRTIKVIDKALLMNPNILPEEKKFIYIIEDAVNGRIVFRFDVNRWYICE